MRRYYEFRENKVTIFYLKNTKMRWLPTELWVDIFKLLNRRALLRIMQPACRRFHAIAELQVSCVHVIMHAQQFIGECESDEVKILMFLVNSKMALCKCIYTFCSSK